MYLAHYSPSEAIRVFDNGLHFVTLLVQCLTYIECGKNSGYVVEQGDLYEMYSKTDTTAKPENNLIRVQLGCTI
jgi:hypothetical protein